MRRSPRGITNYFMNTITQSRFLFAGAALLVLTVFCGAFLFGGLAQAEDAAPPADSAPVSSEATPPPPPPPPEEPATTSSVEAPSEEGSEGEEGTGEGSPEGDASLTTGDAVASTDTQNGINENILDSETGSTTVVNTNDATTTNDSATTAGTGNNTASGGDGTASIETGDAFASANAINVINANIINSSGLIAFLNFFFGNGGGIDLSGLDLSYFFGNSESTPSCSFDSCGSSLNVVNENGAVLDNTMFVQAMSGQNGANGQGTSTIATGNAYASANVINVINTNLLNSHYLLLALNNFGDLLGDITLPGADFFKKLMEHQSAGSSAANMSVNNNNVADVTSSTTVAASTGSNNASGTPALITTGNAGAGATTVNQINTNLIGGTTVFILLNVFGPWTGSVQGLPEGLSWVKTPTGIAIVSGSGDFSPLSPSTSNENSTLAVSNNNNATVNNNIGVYALTGENQATSASGTASITTGNAFASANILNLVNSNVIGQNWIFAIFNIFGGWNGNFSFGGPDLWIGGVAETSNPTAPGGAVTYRFTVANNGNSDAPNTVLTAKFPKNYLAFDSVEGESETSLSWNLGTIRKGEVKDFVYTARAGVPGRGESVTVPLIATLTTTGADGNLDDNTENLSINIWDGVNQGVGAPRGVWTPDPKITMEKTVSSESVTTPGSVDYKLVIKNNGGEAYRSKLTDTLTDPDGKVVYTRSWNLDTIPSGDELKLTYTIQYGTSSNPGTYTNTARLTARTNNYMDQYAFDMTPVVASSTVEVVKGEVLGVSTGPAEPQKCAAYISSYIKPGASNDPTQVRRLQFFLRDFANEPITPNGTYDSSTLAALMRFQRTHAEDILTPWGETNPTGFVYYTTQTKINNMYCKGVTEFNLSDVQVGEISIAKKSKSGISGGVNQTTSLKTSTGSSARR